MSAPWTLKTRSHSPATVREWSEAVQARGLGGEGLLTGQGDHTVLGGDMQAKARPGRAVSLVLLLLCSSALALVSPAAATIPDVDFLEAKNLQASFDTQSEVTTLTWENVQMFDSNLVNLTTAVYHVYRYEGVLDASTLDSATLIATVRACDDSYWLGQGSTAYLNCRQSPSGSHTGHQISYPVPPGTNGTFNYTIVTEVANVNYSTFSAGDSVTSIGVEELTQDKMTPYNIRGDFSSTSSTTTLSWVPFTSLPGGEVIPGAARLLVYRSIGTPMTRATMSTMLQSGAAVQIGNLSSNASDMVLTISPDTDRDAYYAVTYFLPNWLGMGQAYIDYRFLTANSLTSPVEEDNTPPDRPTGTLAVFGGLSGMGTSNTTVSWIDVPGETGESYQIYTSGTPFSSIYDTGVRYVGTQQEGAQSFVVNHEHGHWSESYYCVVAVDRNGAFDHTVSNAVNSNCAGPVAEDAWSPWLKVPTNVHAEFMGDGITRVTWLDQLGVEGERYHIWYSTFYVTPAMWVENQSVTWMGYANDGVEFFDVVLPEGMERENAFYFVTTEALYGTQTGSMMLTGAYDDENGDSLNWFGPIVEDTLPPRSPDINDVVVRGDLLESQVTWQNDEAENNEQYHLYRHTGDPFAEDAVSDVLADGWEHLMGPIGVPNNGSKTLIASVPIEEDLDRQVHYAVVIEDEWGNLNPDVFEGDNSKQVHEDTRAPEVLFALLDETGNPYVSPSLVAGEYRLLAEVMDVVGEALPTVEVLDADGNHVTTGGILPMQMYQDNIDNPDRGPVYNAFFTITSQTEPGELLIRVNVTDASGNFVSAEDTSWFVDARGPTVSIFSPSPSSDGSKYLYGNDVTLLASASDDVRVDRIQYRITYNLDTGSLSTPWADVTTGLSTSEDNRTVLVSLDFAAGNFELGRHQISVQAIDAAGNVRTSSVIFTIDFCNHREDGSTQCQYEEALKGDPDPIVIKPGLMDPPYVFVWVMAGLLLMTIIAAIGIATTSMRTPKKSGDEEEDEDWMSEFIGTSQDLDMAAITGTGGDAKEEKKDVPEVLEDEDDPFAVNKPDQKRRRRSKKDEEDDDDEEDGFMDMLSEAEDDEDDEEEEEAPRRTRPATKRRAASSGSSREAPKRRAVKRPSDDDEGDEAPKRRAPPKRRAVKRKDD
jgi:hypothetical protein